MKSKGVTDECKALKLKELGGKLETADCPAPIVSTADLKTINDWYDQAAVFECFIESLEASCELYKIIKLEI